VKHAAAVVPALLLVACTLGPATGADGGTTGTPVAPRSVGDQCQDVLSAYCQRAASCALPVAGLMDCINNTLPLCCTGSQCDQTSQISEAAVTDCEQAFAAELCNDVAATTNPAMCLQSS
jgi:hypothetical protein